MAWANSSLRVVGCPLYDPNPPSRTSSTRSLAHDNFVVPGDGDQRRGKPGVRLDSDPQRSDSPTNRPPLPKQHPEEAGRGFGTYSNVSERHHLEPLRSSVE